MHENSTLTIVQQIAGLMEEKFVFPDVGKQVADYLRQWLDDKKPLLSPPELADVLNETFTSLTHDSHLRIDYDPKRASGGDNTEELMRRHFEQALRNNFGFLKVERLAGNIGYLKIQEFPPPEPAMILASGAMAFVANTQGLIFDIRGHKGGSPEMVQLLISYLVDNQPKQLTGIYSREMGQTEAYYTLEEIPGKRMSDVPVYIIVNGETHSGGEAFSYDLQALKRATIIGARTRGGAHLVDFIPLQSMYVLMLPVARAINPITNSNWQGTGVIPDIKVTDQDPLLIAHHHMLNELLKSATNEDEKEFLQAEMKTLTPLPS